MTTTRERMAPCLPGAELWILDENDEVRVHKTVTTAGWHALAWGGELMRRDVGILLCSGIDQFLWGALQGYGIQVIPNAMGMPNKALEQWRSGELTALQMWPPYPPLYGRGRCGKGRRFRGGR